MISAGQLQEILAVSDNRVILHGRSPGNNYVYVYFQQGRLVWTETLHTGVVLRSKFAEKRIPPSFFFDANKWYQNATNPGLRHLLATCSPVKLPEVARPGLVTYGFTVDFGQVSDHGVLYMDGATPPEQPLVPVRDYSPAVVHDIVASPLRGIDSRWQMATVLNGPHVNKAVCILIQFADGWCICELGENEPMAIISIANLRLWVPAKAVVSKDGRTFYDPA